jgi:hypothetical protein
MRPQPPPPRRIIVDVAFLRVLEEYLGDRPYTDKIAADLHARVVELLSSEGLL